MKKIIVLFLFLFVAAGGYAKQSLELSNVLEKTNAQMFATAEKLQKAVKTSDVAAVKKLLAETDRYVWTLTDKYGNNLFHLCEDPQVFEILHFHLAAESEKLLAQRNHIGETPWVKYIMYGKEDLFLMYFPQSTLYARLAQATRDLKLQGLAGQVAREKRNSLIQECSVAGQTMWQRADIMCKGLKQAKGYARYTRTPYNAPGMNNAASTKNRMEEVRDMIAQVAPFLVRR